MRHVSDAFCANVLFVSEKGVERDGKREKRVKKHWMECVI